MRSTSPLPSPAVHHDRAIKQVVERGLLEDITAKQRRERRMGKASTYAKQPSSQVSVLPNEGMNDRATSHFVEGLSLRCVAFATSRGVE